MDRVAYYDACPNSTSYATGKGLTSVMRDYRSDLAALGLQPGAEWEEVRSQYKRLIGQWHPDKHAMNAADVTLAEEQSKKITAAYAALEQLHRDYGGLPVDTPVANASSASAPAAAQAAGAVHRGHRAQRATFRASKHRHGSVVRARPSRAVLGALTAAVLLAYGASHYWETPSIGVTEPNRFSSRTGESQPAPSAPHDKEPSRSISVGSTFGEVYAIQGVPTSTVGDTWYYGKSQIRFTRGAVISWVEDPGYPLRVARKGDMPRRGNAIKVGSTMDEVRAVQGNPIVETSSVWDYGPSRVYFQQGRVVGWENSPMRPLRVGR